MFVMSDPYLTIPLWKRFARRMSGRETSARTAAILAAPVFTALRMGEDAPVNALVDAEMNETESGFFGGGSFRRSDRDSKTGF